MFVTSLWSRSDAWISLKPGDRTVWHEKKRELGRVPAFAKTVELAHPARPIYAPPNDLVSVSPAI